VVDRRSHSDIFAQRAQSRAGKLQVELATGIYATPTDWAGQAISRLGGGIGLAVPVKQKLETERRAISRIADCNRKLPASPPLTPPTAPPTSGGSLGGGCWLTLVNPLLNALTNAEITPDQLFATLTPRDAL